MHQDKTVLERAFDLARSGQCATVDDIRRRLKAENYNQHVVEGRSLVAQLRTLITAARLPKAHANGG